MFCSNYSVLIVFVLGIHEFDFKLLSVVFEEVVVVVSVDVSVVVSVVVSVSFVVILLVGTFLNNFIIQTAIKMKSILLGKMVFIRTL